MNTKYSSTVKACFIGFIVQAIVNNFAPLLFLTFRSAYGIPLAKITLLITLNFGLQLATDAASALFIDRIGYRASAVLAHILAAGGLVLLAVLPSVLDPFAGLAVAAAIYAVGGGLLEVLMSPIVEDCPSENKQSAMSMLHSFYCWGQAAVVLISTAYFAVFGIDNWRWLAIAWAAVPAVNAVLFTRVPMPEQSGGSAEHIPFRSLIKNPVFVLMFLLMLCAGASELSMSQWASTFAERGLGVSKAVGDLAGPMLFALAMGAARTLFGKFGERLDLSKMMLLSGAACIACYLAAALSPWPALGLVGCALCGFTVGILWPGTFSMSASRLRGGGTAMFAILALAGDVGCMTGPTLVGAVSGAAGDDLRAGLLAALVFPTALIVCIAVFRRMTNAGEA